MLFRSRFMEEEVACPEWTTSRAVAEEWISKGSIVVCRTLLQGHSGRGIVLAQSGGTLMVPAPLYVRYKKKRSEYRIHVFRGAVIDVAEKRRMRRERRPESYDGYIRNHANGWIFARDGVTLPADAGPLAVRACMALGLDFGACDIIYNEHDNKSYCLEVNTAPGLEGTTLERYTQAILNWMEK